MKHLLCRVRLMVLLTVAVDPALAQEQAATPGNGRAMAERLLAAMGGRDAWKGVAGLRVDATHHQTDQPAPYSNTIWNDFTRPRLRFEARNAQLHSIIEIDGDTGWRQRDSGPQQPLTPERIADERAWWGSNIYRTLQRLAADDPSLMLRAAQTDGLEIWESETKRLNWFRLNPAGEPVLFGTGASDAGTVFGPLAEGPGGIRYPRWGASQDGGFRYEITSVQMFARPPVVP
ncbi:MAG: hypothetical protein SFV19_10385 [Rhodospirillaceae bacterium]|nr:hypothetical protein [Rhodospirillaceae bacterium]